jgi:hydroxymethylpyrimidine pyrophosphatase-like HAD family hydrolase
LKIPVYSCEHPYRVCRIASNEDYFAQKDALRNFFSNAEGNLVQGHLLRAQISIIDLTLQVKQIDIIPIEAGKRAALSYVQEKLGISPTQTLVIGKSETDFSMFIGDEQKILVKNSSPKLTRRVSKIQSSLMNIQQSDLKYGHAVIEALQKVTMTSRCSLVITKLRENCK